MRNDGQVAWLFVFTRPTDTHGHTRQTNAFDANFLIVLQVKLQTRRRVTRNPYVTGARRGPFFSPCLVKRNGNKWMGNFESDRSRFTCNRCVHLLTTFFLDQEKPSAG